jgi:hypothetical protein
MVKKRFIMSIGILCLCAVGINMRDSSKEIKQGNIQKTTHTIKKNNNEYKFPSKYTEYNGNVIFDTEIIVDSKSEKRIFYQGTAIQKKINFKPLRDEIFANSLETVEESTIDSTNYVGEKGELKIWQTPSEGTLYCSNVNSSYVSPLFYHISQAFTLPENKEDKSVWSKTEEFADFSRESAWQKLNELFKKMGINLPEEYVCYTLPAAVMAERESARDVYGNEDETAVKSDWTDKDDSYYFVFQSRYCGLPTYHPFAFQQTRDCLENEPVQAAISKKGLEYLSVERIFEYRQKEKSIQLKSFDEIAAAMETQFSEILEEKKYTVTRAELKALEKMTGKSDYTMTPVWIICVEAEDDSGTYQFQKVFDAETAREIIFS